VISNLLNLKPRKWSLYDNEFDGILYDQFDGHLSSENNEFMMKKLSEFIVSEKN